MTFGSPDSTEPTPSPTTSGDSSTQTLSNPTTSGDSSAQTPSNPTTSGDSSAQTPSIPATSGDSSAHPLSTPATSGDSSAQPTPVSSAPATPSSGTNPTNASSACQPAADKKSGYSWGKFAFDAFFIIAVSIVICSANETILRSTILPPSSNDAMHFNFLAAYSNAASHASSWWEAILITLCWPGFYPPGSYLITYLYSQLFGTGVIPSLTSLTVFIPVIVASIYFIVRPRCGPLAAMVAVLAASAVPQGLLCCPRYPSDLQVACGACASLCVLFSCDVGRRRWLTWLFGLVFGYSLLFKSNVAWFIAPALAVLLISRWRDWLRSPLSVLWHLSLFVGAFIISLRTTSAISADIQEEMIRYSTFLSPTVQKILWLVAGVAAAWWVLSLVHFGKLRYIPMLTNFSQAIALTYLISMPWILVNLGLVGAQRDVFWNQILAYSRPDHLKICAQSIYDNSFGSVFLVMLGLSLLFSLTKWASIHDRALSLTVVFVFVATACCLGPAPRYFFPCFLVSACCLATPLRKNKFIACLSVGLGIVGLMMGIVIPTYPNLREQCNDILHHYGCHEFPAGHCYNRTINPNECIFSKVWQICPALADPNGIPRLVLLRQDQNRVRMNPSPHDFGFDAIEDTYHAIITWTSWRNSSLIPLYARDNEHIFFGERGAYVQFIETTNLLNPELAGWLRKFLTCHRPEQSAVIFEQLKTKCSHLLDLSTDYAPGLTATEACRMMNCSNPVHFQVEMRNCVLHLWSRPEVAPKPDEMNLKANHFAPHIEWYGIYPI